MTKIFSSKATNRKGGEMMKIFGLTLALAMVIGGAASADVATIDIYAGWNQIACPLVPMDLSASTGDITKDYTEPAFAFVPASMTWDDANNTIWADMQNSGLNRFEATTGGQPTYLIDDNFGKLLLGEGYQLYSSVPQTIQYQGLPDGLPGADSKKTDMWLTLPGLTNDTADAGGWHLIGTPYGTELPAYYYNAETEELKWYIQFTDGNEVVDWQTACEVKNWVTDTLVGAGPGGQVTVSYLNDPSTGGLIAMQPGQSYWLLTFKDNIAMILTAPGN